VDQTLKIYQKQLAALEDRVAENGDDVLAGHLSAITREIRLKYANSDGEMPLAFFSLASQPVPLSWDSILALGTHNHFIDTTVISWILCMSPAVVGHTSYAGNHAKFVGFVTPHRTGWFTTREIVSLWLRCYVRSAALRIYEDCQKARQVRKFLFLYS
jgi:hypothetical protein